MATARVIITDGPKGITVVVDADPGIPVLDGGEPDVDHPTFTAAMACAVYAAVQIADSAGEKEWRYIAKEPDRD
jgi:hypothetical protein